MKTTSKAQLVDHPLTTVHQMTSLMRNGNTKTFGHKKKKKKKKKRKKSTRHKHSTMWIYIIVFIGDLFVSRDGPLMS